MGTISEKLSYLNQTKADIKQAIIDKGVLVEDTDTFRSYATKIGEIQAGGGSVDSGGQYLVRVIDYDGTVLKQDHLNTGDTFTLPDAPTNHSRLVFQEWSSPVDITDNTITVENQDIIIGAVYTTASGLSEFDITLTKVTGLSVTLNMNGTKNWGDGTSDTLTTHTYTDYGDYTITCDGTTMTTSSSSGLFGQSSRTYYCTDIFIANVTSIGTYAFTSCTSLKSITISNSVTSIGNYAFYNCYGLTGSLIIPDSVTSIGDRAFYYCYSLTPIIPNSVTSIGANAFYGCYSLKSITIPNSVTSIGANAFYGCYSLKSITIPNSVTSIGTSAFGSCTSLKSITIPNSVTRIIDSTFTNCASLKSITIPNSVTRIGIGVFTNCYSLKSITIPNSVTSIMNRAFYSCYSLIKYDFTQSTEVPALSGSDAFTNINDICKIYVPDSLYDEWIVATNWATYADYIYKASEMPQGD